MFQSSSEERQDHACSGLPGAAEIAKALQPLHQEHIRRWIEDHSSERNQELVVEQVVTFLARSVKERRVVQTMVKLFISF